MKRRTLIINICIVLFGTLAFVTGIGGARLFDWDEINFAESAREMVTTGDWFNVQINYESFWEKPPLFIWMQALSMKVFGIGEFAARFPNAIMGIITLLLLFNIGRKTKDERFGLLWMGAYAASFLPFFYFKSGIIDPWFNVFIFLGIYFFSRYSDPHFSGQRSRNAALSAAAIGLGILTKGPVALLVFGLTFIVWLIAVRFKLSFRWKDVLIWLAVLCLVGGSWFAALALTGHQQVITDFIQYQIRLLETQDANHGGFLLYHFVILFFGVAPASILALGSFRRKALSVEDNARLAGLFRWMMASFWVVLILFTIVRTKIVHYNSFCYFPLTFLAAWCVDKMLDGKIRFKNYQRVVIIFIACLLGVVLTAITKFDRLKLLIVPSINDPFAQSCLEAHSEWVGYEQFLGIILIAGAIWTCTAFKRRQTVRNLLPMAVGNILFLFVAMTSVVGEVEKYSQASAVDFYVSKQGEDCYILPTYFKSYAQYFYSDRQKDNTCDDFDYLRTAELDKPCYFVIKDDPYYIKKFREDVPDAKQLYRKSGFRFFVREKFVLSDDAACEEHCEQEIE